MNLEYLHESWKLCNNRQIAKSIHTTPILYININSFLTLKHKTNQYIYIVLTRWKNVYSRLNGLIFLFETKTCPGCCQTFTIIDLFGSESSYVGSKILLALWRSSAKYESMNEETDSMYKISTCISYMQ